MDAGADGAEAPYREPSRRDFAGRLGSRSSDRCVEAAAEVAPAAYLVCIEQHSIHYHNPGTTFFAVAAIYVLVTCGALILSGHRVVRWFGWLNFVGVIATLIVKGYAFTSIWCLYAAVMSLVLYWQFGARRIDIAEPNNQLRNSATA